VLSIPCAAEISDVSLSPQTETTHITEKAKTNSTNTTILFIVILSISPFVFVAILHTMTAVTFGTMATHQAATIGAAILAPAIRVTAHGLIILIPTV